MKNNQDILDEFNQTYLPFEVISVKKGHGSFIQFDLNSIKGTSKNNIELLIYLTYWRFINENNQEILNSDEITLDYNNGVFEIIKLTQIKSIKLLSNKSIEIIFSNSIVLILTADLAEYEEDDDLFMCFIKRENKVISYSPEKLLYEEKIKG